MASAKAAGSSAPTIRPLVAASRASLRDSVHDSLLTWLMDGNTEPGSPLSIDALARDLGVSPTPVREAMALLESTGLVERVALRGYRVARLLTPEEMHALMDARLLIECRNARVLAEKVDPALLSALEDALARQRESGKGPAFADYRDYHAADHEFHRLINEGAGNPFLAGAFAGLNGQVQRFRMRLLPRHGISDAPDAVAEHAAVLTALQARDPDGAEASMRRHLEAVRRRAGADVLSSAPPH